MNEIEKRKEEDPNKIDDVPVQTDQIDRGEIVRSEISACRAIDQHSNHNHSDNDVESVQAGHCVIDCEE